MSHQRVFIVYTNPGNSSKNDNSDSSKESEANTISSISPNVISLHTHKYPFNNSNKEEPTSA